jgi:outer membrane protein assembly factor BamD
MLALTACSSKFRKIEKNPDWRVKYEGAQYFYEKGDYYKASLLYEAILPIVRGLPEGENVQFHLAYCQFYDKLYFISAEYFKTFFETYGRSVHVEEARFMYANSLYMAVPEYNKDQTAGIDAMSAMQDFINRYPESKFSDQAIDAIVKSQEKLERKGFANARQYYKMERYKACIIAMENFEREFPDSDYKDEADFLIVSSQFKLAESSIYSKQEERYKEVIERYTELVDSSPNNPYLKEAEKYFTLSKERLTKFKRNNQS